MTVSPAAIAIRPMTAGDVEWAQRMAEEAPQAPHWPAGAYQAAIDPRATPRRLALIAETPKAAAHLDRLAPRAGFAIASLLPPDSELEMIVVAPGVRRQGVGRAIFTVLIRELVSSGVTEVTLEVRVSNQPALALYRALGFMESAQRPRYYVDPVEDAVLMRLALRCF
jgi:[ribosomal protein S18]-alanine N-acetyltransferase